MRKTDAEKIFELTGKLIFLIKELRVYSDYQNSPLDKIIQNLERMSDCASGDSVKLARMQFPLSKNLDYYSFDLAENTQKNKIFDITRKIVIESKRIISSNVDDNQKYNYQICQKAHQNKACLIGSHTDRFYDRTECGLVSKDGTEIPFDQYVNFIEKPVYREVDIRRKLIRVGSKVGSNKIDGAWWAYECDLPQSISKWRKDFAVLEEWNLGTDKISIELESPVFAWFGKAASQQVICNDCILIGGADQLWIPPANVKKIIASNSRFKCIPENKWGELWEQIQWEG